MRILLPGCDSYRTMVAAEAEADRLSKTAALNREAKRWAFMESVVGIVVAAIAAFRRGHVKLDSAHRNLTPLRACVAGRFA